MFRRDARAVLGLGPLYEPADVEAAFRAVSWRTHPDRGGDPEHFAAAVEARRVLLERPLPDRPVLIRDDRGAAGRLVGRLKRRSSPPRVV